MQLPFLVGYLEKRCYLNKARIYMQVPNKQANRLQVFLSELGVQCEIRQPKSLNVVSLVTSSPANTRVFQKVVEPYRYFVRSERLKKLLEKEIKGKVKIIQL